MGPQGPPGPPVSILYEADRLCNLSRVPAFTSAWVAFQSSTRQTDFATHEFGPRPTSMVAVSILYEADRLCNLGLCNGSRRPTSGFNPLRGRQTLQPGSCRCAPRRLRWFQSSTRQTDFATGEPWGRRPSPRRFQSSTRQTDFATGCPRCGHGRLRVRFNPLRGRQTLQRVLSSSSHTSS